MPPAAPHSRGRPLHLHRGVTAQDGADHANDRHATGRLRCSGRRRRPAPIRGPHTRDHDSGPPLVAQGHRPDSDLRLASRPCPHCFLAEVRGRPRRNLALELPRKLLNDEIKLRGLCPRPVPFERLAETVE